MRFLLLSAVLAVEVNPVIFPSRISTCFETVVMSVLMLAIVVSCWVISDGVPSTGLNLIVCAY